MFSFLVPKDRWKWSSNDQVPNKRVIRFQRQALNGSNNEVKARLLEHLVDLAGKGASYQEALCDAKVTADVCKCFVTEAPMVQEGAAHALSALCHQSPANCEALLNAHYKTQAGSDQHVIPRALALIQSFDKHVSLATAAGNLIEVVGAGDPAAVAQVLLRPGRVDGILSVVRNCSRLSLASATPPAMCAKLLRLLEQLLQALHTVAAGSGTALCMELSKAQGVKLMLDLAQAHRGQGPVPGSDDGHGDHPAVVRAALSLLRLVVSQVPANKLRLLEFDGVRQLLAVMRDMSLPWSVRLRTVEALQDVCASPAVAVDFIKAKGLEFTFALMADFVAVRPPGASPGGSAHLTPPRAVTAAPAGPLASPRSPNPGDAALWSSPSGPMSPVGAESEVVEPRGVIVVEQLLRLVYAVASNPDAAMVVEAPRVGLLMSAFACGMANPQAGGYRMATGSAQVLFRAARQPGPSLPATLSSSAVTSALICLVDRAGQGYAAAADAKQAQVVYGAWCAVGFLSQVMSAERRNGRQQQVLAGEALRASVRLLGDTTPVLLAAVGAAPPEGMNPVGLVFLTKEQVVQDLSDAASSLLQLLMTLGEEVSNRQTLRNMGFLPAVKQLVNWRHVQWSAKRLLHLMGEMEAEYQPFVRYGCGPLLAALLSSQGIDPAPFLARRVDAHILLKLDDDYMRRDLGLDNAAVLKVGRIRAAYALFADMDMMDGRIDGCVSAADVEAYLQNKANFRSRVAADLRERLFGDLQVLPGEPICFMQFMGCYPWLSDELQSWVRTAAATSGSIDDYTGRSSKRQRIGGAVDAGASTPPGQTQPPEHGHGRVYIEKD